MAPNARDTFVANLNRYMKLRGIEQADLVQTLELSASTVSDWANGKKYPRVDSMQRLADALGVAMSELTAENDGKTTDNNAYQLSGVYFRFAKDAEKNGIHPDDIADAIDMIKRLRGGKE